MTILSNVDIKKAIKSGEIYIDPFDENAVGPCSVDLTLSDKFTVFTAYGKLISPSDRKEARNNSKLVITDGKPFTLSPGQFILGQTQEAISIPKTIAGTLEGRSSVARLGLVVHAAGLVNPGTGLKDPSTLTLEIYCQINNPIQLIPGMGIMQIMFHRLSSPCTIGYDERETSNYVGLKSPHI